MTESIRNFDDIPVDAKFADKFGRVFTKTSRGSARSHEAADSRPDYTLPLIDDSREYYEMTEEDVEDDPFVFDTWPYYLLGDTAESVDPTAIEIDFDPQQQRMSGVAFHGNTPFDVPFISEIAPNLWQGGCRRGLVLPEFITHLVSLYPWEAYTYEHDLDSAINVRMYDSNEQGFGQVDALAGWVNSCRETGPVLVHCQAGLNRSSLVAARALMLGGATAVEAIATIREKRSPACLCNESFEEWLLGLDAEASA